MVMENLNIIDARLENKIVLDEVTFSRTMVHELWHTLSRYLPEKDLIAYKKEFNVPKVIGHITEARHGEFLALALSKIAASR